MNFPLRRGAFAPAETPALQDLGVAIQLIKALRIWTQARLDRCPPQPRLVAFLHPLGQELLAPQYDGVFTCLAGCLGKPLEVSKGCDLSADERWLVGQLGLAEFPSAAKAPQPGTEPLFETSLRLAAGILLEQTDPAPITG